jgi:LysR family transcriptional regulator, hydrogen peroxide-inducible genes activator
MGLEAVAPYISRRQQALKASRVSRGSARRGRTMEMQQVVYFRALCEELNFTRAARRCNVSQPSLTRSIRLLEEEFGGALFHRERNHTHLSELGQLVKPHLDQILTRAEAASREARGLKDLTQVRLKLGVMCTVAPSDVVQLLIGVRAGHPGVHLELIDATAEELDSRLRAGELEAAILAAPDHTREPHLHYLPLFREQFVIVSAIDHRFANLNVVRVSDLKAESYLRRVNCEVGELFGKARDEHDGHSEIVYRSDRDDWILEMAAAGVGYAFMPERSVVHPQVVSKPLVDPEIWREVSLVTVRGRPHSTAVGALVREAMRSPWANERALAAVRFEQRSPGADVRSRRADAFRSSRST